MYDYLVQGIIHKVHTPRFRNFRPPSPPACTCTYAFSLQLLPPRRSVRIVFFKEDMTDIFCELLSRTTNNVTK